MKNEFDWEESEKASKKWNEYEKWMLKSVTSRENVQFDVKERGGMSVSCVGRRHARLG